MGRGFQVIAIRPKSGITYVLGKNKYQYAIGIMIGKNNNRPIWKRYISDTNVPEGVSLGEVSTLLFFSNDPFHDPLMPIITAYENKPLFFGSNYA